MGALEVTWGGLGVWGWRGSFVGVDRYEVQWTVGRWGKNHLGHLAFDAFIQSVLQQVHLSVERIHPVERIPDSTTSLQKCMNS